MDKPNKLQVALTAIGDVLALIPEETWEEMSAEGMPERFRKILEDTTELEGRIVLRVGNTETITLQSMSEDYVPERTSGIRIRAGEFSCQTMWDDSMAFTMRNGGTVAALEEISRICLLLSERVRRDVAKGGLK